MHEPWSTERAKAKCPKKGLEITGASRISHSAARSCVASPTSCPKPDNGGRTVAGGRA